MSLSDEEALFDDIYGDDEKTEVKPEPKQEDSSEEKPEEESKTEVAEIKKEDDVSNNEEATKEESKEPISSSSEANNEAHEETKADDSVQTEQSLPSAPPPPPPPQDSSYNNSSTSAGERRKADLSRDAGKMFIGGLDWDTTEDKLKEYFSQFGEVIDHTIMRENSTGRSRGFGFLTFASSESVDKVVRTQHVLDGKVIDPKRAIPRDEQDKTGKIFVGGLAPEVRPHEFEAFFAKFGTIIDAQLMLDKNTGRSRGFGFVTFDSPDAVDRVCQSKYIDFNGRQIEVKRAEPRGPQQQQNHIQQQQQRYMQQQGMGGIPNMGNMFQQQDGATPAGATPEAMAEYWQRLQQYWMQMQQQGNPQFQAYAQQFQQLQQMQQQQQGQGSADGSGSPASGSETSMPSFPQGPAAYSGAGGSRNNGYGNNRRGGGGGNYRGGRGRGGYQRGGYHPYQR